MSTASSSCSGTPERKPYLPVDLLLVIIARSDVTTVVRCAATSRILRRAMLSPAFLRRLTADGHGVHPARLFGVSYRATDIRGNFAHRVIDTLPSALQPRARLDPSSLGGLFEPVASRDGLLLSYRFGNHVELRVCDTLTGHATLLPRIAISYTYGHVFLSVGYAGESYELVVVDLRMRFQTFSSEHGQWGAPRQVSIAEEHGTNEYRPLAAPHPAVLGRTVYWPYTRDDDTVCWDRILAMDVDAAEGTVMELPPGCLSRMMAPNESTHLLLASMCGSLSLLVLESDGISMWTLTPASPTQSTATWSRQLLIGKVEILKMVGLVYYTDDTPFVLEGFGERSGAVIVRVGNGDLLRLDLGTRIVKRLRRQEGNVFITGLFLHETADLVSLLQAMKYF